MKEDGAPIELKALNKAVEKGDLAAFPQALSNMVATTWRKRWPEQVLGDVLAQHKLDQDTKTEMVRQMLACRKPPRPQYSVGNDSEFYAAQDLALDTKSYGSIVLLYQAGFLLPDSAHLTMAAQLGAGLWPHPDLIAPEILITDAKHNRLFFERIFKEEGLSVEFVDKLATLQRNEATHSSFARWLARLNDPGEEAARDHLLGDPGRVKAMARLMEHHMIDVDLLHKKGGNMLSAIEAAILRVSLEEGTSRPSEAPARPRSPRL